MDIGKKGAIPIQPENQKMEPQTRAQKPQHPPASPTQGITSYTEKNMSSTLKCELSTVIKRDRECGEFNNLFLKALLSYFILTQCFHGDFCSCVSSKQL